jgi:ribonuclease E
VSKKLLINAAQADEARFALIESGKLAEYMVERVDEQEVIGNIYLGRVARVDARHEACFIDISLGKDAFVPFSDLPNNGSAKTSTKKGDLVIVQVKREAVGNKGAAGTGFVSIAGRFGVLMPGSENGGVSRKVVEEKERERLRKMVKSLKRPANTGLILRTAATGQTKKEIEADVTRMQRLWRAISSEAKKAKGPCLLYRETDPIRLVLRDLMGVGLNEIVVDDPNAQARVEQYVKQLSGRTMIPVRLHADKVPLFEKTGADAQVARLSSRNVPLPSGGSIVIDQTEALVAIDVNSGRTKAKSHDQVILRSNLEAAEAVATEIRLRDLGGIIVVDFIDMHKATDRREVERTLKAAMKGDRSRHKIYSIGPNGTLEVTRKRLRSRGTQLDETTCSTCGGSGTVPSSRFLANEVRRRIEAQLREGTGWIERITVRVPLDAANDLNNRFRTALSALEDHHRCELVVVADAYSQEVSSLDVVYRSEARGPTPQAPRVSIDDVEAAGAHGDDLDEPFAEGPTDGGAGGEPTSGSTTKRRRRRRGGRKRSGAPQESTRGFLTRGENHTGGTLTLLDELVAGVHRGGDGEVPTPYAPAPPEPVAEARATDEASPPAETAPPDDDPAPKTVTKDVA